MSEVRASVFDKSRMKGVPMRNVFVAMKLKALAMSELARSAALMCFNLGLLPRDEDDDPTHKLPGRNAYSKHTVAQDKRDAAKRRNVKRGKR